MTTTPEVHALALARGQLSLTDAINYLTEAGNTAPSNSQAAMCLAAAYRLSTVLEGDTGSIEGTSVIELAKCAMASLPQAKEDLNRV